VIISFLSVALLSPLLFLIVSGQTEGQTEGQFLNLSV
jgi:hypothetical protein